MATGKRYFWIKLKDTFFTSDTVDFLMQQQNGAEYVVLYQMLCMKTANTNGRMERKLGEVIIPYDEAKIQRDCKFFSIDTVRVALNLYKKLGLVYEDKNGALVITNHNEMVGSETDYANQKRNQRLQGVDNVHLLSTPMSTECPENVHENVHTDIEKDKEIEIDIEKEKEIEIEIEQEIDSCSDRCTETVKNDRSVPKKTPSSFSIILNDGSFYNVSQEDIDEYKRLYPNVNIEQSLRNMAGWSNANTTRRKTIRGVKRFISAWLMREQDSGKSSKKTPARDLEYPDEDDIY